jgi:signal transduction histidine kinase
MSGAGQCPDTTGWSRWRDEDARGDDPPELVECGDPPAMHDRAAGLGGVLALMADGLVLHDAHGAVTFMNPAAERMLSPRVAGDSRAGELVDAAGTPIPVDDLPFARALRGETVRQREMGVLRDGLPPLWVSANAVPLGAPGARAGALVTLTEVTALHEVQERREDLIRTISHDLRTPLAAILLHGALLQRAAPTPEVERRATAIRRLGDSMAAMLDELVQLVKLEGPSAEPETRAVELVPFLDEVADRVGGAARSRIEVTPAEPAYVRCDPLALERAVTNLLTNALKYSPAPLPITVRVSLTPGERVEIAVADRGPGIPADEQERIFARFVRRERDQRSEGLGLGLYITRLLVERLGGRIRVESAVGQGSTFVMTLPRASAVRGAERA